MAFGSEEETTRVLVQIAAVGGAVAVAVVTRPLSWLRSVSFGTHPCTNGTRFFTGGHRCRVRPTPKGFLMSRWPMQAGKASGSPSQRAEQPLTGRMRRAQFVEDMTFSPRMKRGAHTATEGLACWRSRWGSRDGGHVGVGWPA